MADSFKGTKHVTLRPGDAVRPLWLKFKPATASTANDGAIPYGSTLHSFAVEVKDAITNTATTELHSSLDTSSNTGIIYLQHSTAVSTGLYYIIATATVALSGVGSNMVKDYNFERLYVANE